MRWRRVSDDDYWKDFPHGLPTQTPRLYDSHANIERQLNARNWGLGDSQTILYGGVQTWQTLRDLDPTSDRQLSDIAAPYRREPQLGVRSRSGAETGLVWSLQGEFNRFTHQDQQRVTWIDSQTYTTTALPTGNRLHAIADVSRPFSLGGVNITPRLSVNSTSYSLDQPMLKRRAGVADVDIHETWRSDTRTLPTASLDTNLSMERPLQMFGKDLTQTLEPRLLYVYTPYRDQSHLPIFDSAPRDFNQYAIFSENAYTGVDRISDANQLTLGVTTRLIDNTNGSEALRLGIVQKLLLADQKINPDEDEPITERLSDLLLLGSTSVIPHWTLDSFMQFDAQNHQTSRGLFGVRYSPGAWRSISANYRYTRNASEQLDLGWQWPLAGRKPPLSGLRDAPPADPLNLTGQRSAGSGECGGTWYSVGRLSYSLRESRLTDSLFGVEYDAGCWIGRIVAERVSVGRATAATRLMFQLELSGLSRISLGSNPLRALRDNIPGYRLLHDENPAPTVPSTGFPSSFSND
ncbi:MAG: LPS-assembly protein LptD [Aquabacterium sp.]